MRIATWNVNGIRARLDFVLHWLSARDPDVVGIQELKTSDEQFPALEIQQAGYYTTVFGQTAWNGVAILSKLPPVSYAAGLEGRESDGARLITARFADFDFTTAYVPNGKDVHHPDFARKLEWLDAFVAAEGLGARDASTILCGDFNLCPDALDSWDEARFAGRIFHTEAERTRFQALLASGYHDLFRELNPGAQVFSWWDYRAGDFHKGRGLRIDFLLGTVAIRRRVRSVVIDREYRKKKEGLIPSDHAPVYADLD
jgi:exodeoxyribonuclease-3